MQSLAPSSSPLTASSRFYRLCAQILVPSSRRHQSSARRTTSKLNIKPDPAFLPTKTEQHDHIIFNPPPSMPNVYHTPNIFLPNNDQRKVKASSAQQLPSPLSQPPEKRYHVTAEQMNEIRALRMEDPQQWSIKKLAKKYDCSALFVAWVTQKLPSSQGKLQAAVTEAVKSNWSKNKRIAREDRELRKESWLRDE